MAAQPKWQRLQTVYELARRKGVGFELVYEEGSSSFYYSVSSPIEAQNWVGKSHSFDNATDSVLEWLNNL